MKGKRIRYILLLIITIIISTLDVNTKAASSRTIIYVNNPALTLVKLPVSAFDGSPFNILNDYKTLSGFTYTGSNLTIKVPDRLLCGNSYSNYQELTYNIKVNSNDWYTQYVLPSEVNGTIGMAHSQPNYTYYYPSSGEQILIDGYMPTAWSESRNRNYYFNQNRNSRSIITLNSDGMLVPTRLNFITSAVLMELDTWTKVSNSLEIDINTLSYNKVYCYITQSGDTYQRYYEYEFFQLRPETEPPTLTVSSTNLAWCKSLYLAVSASDNEALQSLTVNGVSIPTTSTSYSINKNGTYTFVATDTCGNKTTKAITISNIDKTLPTVNIGLTYQ